MSKSKLTLYIDIDEVIAKFLDKLCSEYNYKYNKNIKISDIKTWSLNTYMDGDKAFEIINNPGFFGSLEPIEGAIETIEKLVNSDKYEVFIISSPSNEYSVYEKYKWIQQNLPFFDIRNLILVGNKGELLSRMGNDGILFDDCPEYIEKFNGMSVVMDRAYNKELIVGVDCDYRVSGWDEFYGIVKGLKGLKGLEILEGINK